MTDVKNMDRAAEAQDTWDFEPAGPALVVEAAGRTDCGKQRESNEDQFLVAELAKIMRVEQTSMPEPSERAGSIRAHLFLVADGMGGYAGGDIASRIAARTVEECLLDSLKWFLKTRGSEGDEVAEKLHAAVYEADQRVLSESARRPELRGMGTTLTLAFQLGRELFVAHVGDSRAYLCRGGQLYRMTRDHTLFAELVRRGRVLAEQENTERLRHTITNAIGGSHAGAKADLVRAPVEPGDVLLLCTDGLTDMLSDAEIAAVLAEHAKPESACQRLVEWANERGGHDNITAVVAAFRPGRSEPGNN